MLGVVLDSVAVSLGGDFGRCAGRALRLSPHLILVMVVLHW